MKVKVLLIVFFGFLLAAHPAFLPAGNLTLDYSTYLGGTGNDYGKAVAVDETGCAYVTGHTYSGDFPTENPYQAGAVSYPDIFISRLSSSGASLIYSTYIGGKNYEGSYGIAVDESNCAYVTGSTESFNFPTVNPYQASKSGGGFGESDVFVCKLSSDGSTLVYSTYLGGGGSDRGLGIALKNGGAWITGWTASSEVSPFPTENPYQADYNGGIYDGFISKLSSSGSTLEYSTYLGGSGKDMGHGIAAENVSVYVAGSTQSENFPTINPYQADYAGYGDAFISKLSSTGSGLVYSTYLGGTFTDQANGIAVEDGSVFVAGCAGSDDFPTANPYQADYAGGDDAFISRISSSGSTLICSTYLGGTGDDSGNAIAVDNGYIYVTGWTGSEDFPTLNPYQASHAGGYNLGAFVSKLSPSGSPLCYSTYLGGNGYGYADGIAVAHGCAYVVGKTSADDFPMANPYQSTRSGSDDAFVTKLSLIQSDFVIDSGDYNGDGTSDIAVFRGSSGLWSVRGITRVYFGSGSDLPAPGDYSGDGTAEFGIFRGASGLWAIRGLTRIYFGSSADIPVPGDYDGNGTCDVGIFKSNNGLWALRGLTRIYFGASGDTVVPGDYKGDGTRDVALFRESSGLWALRNISRIYFGSAADETVPGDYDGDGTWEAGIFRTTSGLWAIRGVTRVYFGSSTDQPVPADYDGNAADDLGIFRQSSGLWALREISRVYYGASGDIPVTR